MKTGSGGTDMWCAVCESIRTCKAIPGAEVTARPVDYVQRRYHGEHPDLRWFQRGRRCLTCGNEFLTGEAPLKFLFELVELRDALGEIKAHAEQYIVESEKAADSLGQLTKSLGVLRALRLYKEA